MTRETGTFVRSTPGSQSLERGLQLLRAFRLGTTVLSNADLALRSGLPRTTVSRLTRSLVDAGFLSYDITLRGYRLGVVVVSLANAFRYEVPILEVALPLMRQVADGEGVNVGISVSDHLEMVYLETLRESRRGTVQRGGPGTRFPMEPTAGGRAYIAGLDRASREALLAKLATGAGRDWPRIKREIAQSMRDFSAVGYCVSRWQPDLTTLAAPLVVPGFGRFSLSVGFLNNGQGDEQRVSRVGTVLFGLLADIQEACRTKLLAVPL